MMKGMAGTQSMLMAVLVLTLVDAQDFEYGRAVQNLTVKETVVESPGRAVWNLTVNEPAVELQLFGTEEITILATEEVPIVMSLGRVKITISSLDVHGHVTLQNNVFLCPASGLNISQSLKLVLKLNNSEYEVASGNWISSERVEDGQGTPITIKANFMENMTGIVYVVQSQLSGAPPPLPQPPPLAYQDTSASSLVVGLTSTLVVFLMLLIASVVINVLLLRLLPLGALPAWVQGKPAPTHQVVGLKEVSTIPQGTTGNMNDTESLPEFPPRPIETFATASAVPPVAPKGKYIPKDDPDYDYITAQDVKPVEVEILKQQKLIQGQICYTTLPKPSSAFGSSHP